MYFSDSTGNLPQYEAVPLSRRASVQRTHSVPLKTVSSPPNHLPAFPAKTHLE